MSARSSKSAVSIRAGEPDHSESGVEAQAIGRWSERKIQLLLATCGIFFALLLFEVAYRLFAPYMAERRWRDLPTTYFIPEEASPIGDHLYTATKPPNTYRIVVVGDSFTHGGNMQIFDTFPKRIEQYLNLNIHQPHVEVIAYSKPGVATVHELLMVKRAIEHFDPDLVLLEITLNDPEPQTYRSSHAFEEKYRRNLLQNPVFHIWKSLGFIVRRLSATKANTEYVEYFRGIFRDSANWRVFANSLAQMKEYAAERKVRFAAVLFPLFSFSFDERYPFAEQHGQIHSVLEANAIPYLDLFDSYRNVPADRLQAIPFDDPHPNEIASRIAAERIVLWFRKEKLVPAAILPKRVAKDRPILRTLRLFLAGEPTEKVQPSMDGDRP